jgi:uncharacterized protein YjbJ (UPF0337 family)
MDSNEFEGAAKDLKGKIEDGAGGLTGDSKLQAEGKLDQAAGKIQNRFGETIDQVNEAANAAARRAAELAGEVGHKLNDAGEAIYETGQRAGEAVGRTVQQQPLLSLIGVAVVGYIAAFLIHSPSSPFAPPPPPPRDFRRLATRYLR